MKKSELWSILVMRAKEIVNKWRFMLASYGKALLMGSASSPIVLYVFMNILEMKL